MMNTSDKNYQYSGILSLPQANISRSNDARIFAVGVLGAKEDQV